MSRFGVVERPRWQRASCPCRPRPWGCRTPATTWALVITRSRAYRKPVPSIRREQELATPVILKTRLLTVATTADLASAGSGGSTGRTCVGTRSPNTSGKPRSSISRRNDTNKPFAPPGTALSTASSTCRPADLRRQAGERRRGDRGADEPGDEQQRRNADQRARQRVDGAQRLPDELLADDVADQRGQHLADGGHGEHQARWPRPCAGGPSSSEDSARRGANRAPRTPPPRKPTKDRAPTTKPCR